MSNFPDHLEQPHGDVVGTFHLAHDPGAAVLHIDIRPPMADVVLVDRTLLLELLALKKAQMGRATVVVRHDLLNPEHPDQIANGWTNMGNRRRPWNPEPTPTLRAIMDTAERAETPDYGKDPCGCTRNSSGDIRCHRCGEYVNVKCWACKTPRGEGTCPTQPQPLAIEGTIVNRE